MIDVINSAKRTPYQTLASLLILLFTLFLSLFFFNMTSFFYGILGYVETRPQVTVYFNTKTSTSDIAKVKQAITTSGKASSIKYISQQEALKIYRDLNRDNPLLLEMVSADILPASLEIYAAKPAYLQDIASYLKNQPGVDEVNFQKNIVDKLLFLTTILRRISMGLLVFLIIISTVVLITTTAFKIALKKDEIELFQLLGASNSYVRRPFLAEGVFFGFLSGTAAFLVYFAFYLYLRIFLVHFLADIPRLSFYNLGQFNLYVWPPSLEFIAFSYFLVILFGMGIGLFGTYLATSKYIK